MLDPSTCRLKIDVLKSALFEDVYESAMNAYIAALNADVCRTRMDNSSGDVSVKFAYTAMHGVGFPAFKSLFTAFGFPVSDLVPVASQVDIDPEFPTVKFPNPEEKGALKLAISEAEKSGCQIVLANDPDADRFTCAERQADGSWYQFTGDEIGLLFADWQLLHPRADPCEVGLIVSSVVSSRMVSKLCEVRCARGIPCEYRDCLTGFKWIANESIRLRADNLKFIHLLGYEEAIGYQLSPLVPDKDGVSAACVWAEMVRAWLRKGLRMKERIEQILREEIGFFATNNGYFIIDDPAITKDIFAAFRASGMQALGQFKIRSIRDVTNGVDTSLPEGHKSHLPSTPEAEMISMFFENGAVVTIRASGTEPKVKYYSEMRSDISRADASAQLIELVAVIKRDFYQPHRFTMREQPSM